MEKKLQAAKGQGCFTGCFLLNPRSGSRYNWWCMSSYGGSATNFANVNNNGNPNNASAANTWLSAPI